MVRVFEFAVLFHVAMSLHSRRRRQGQGEGEGAVAVTCWTSAG